MTQSTSQRQDNDREGRDEPRGKREAIRRVVTPQNTATAVATALAAFFAYKSEMNRESHVPAVATLTATVTELTATIRRLDEAVRILEQKVEGLTDAKTTFEAAINSFRLAQQNTDYRIGRIENDVAWLRSKRAD